MLVGQVKAAVEQAKPYYCIATEGTRERVKAEVTSCEAMLTYNCWTIGWLARTMSTIMRVGSEVSTVDGHYEHAVEEALHAAGKKDRLL